MITAHSGSDGTPENSLAFVEKMISNGVKSIEVDVRSSKRGKLYLSHDPIENWRDATNIFMLEELFQFLSEREHRTMVNCDLKEPNLEAEVKRLAEKWDVYEQVVYSGAVDPGHLSAWDHEKIFYNIENCLPNIYPVGCLKRAHFDVLNYFCKKYQIKTLNIHYEFCTEEWIRWCNEEGLQLSLWTVNSMDKIHSFEEKGIFNITTRKAIAYLSAMHQVEKVGNQ